MLRKEMSRKRMLRERLGDLEELHEIGTLGLKVGKKEMDAIDSEISVLSKQLLHHSSKKISVNN